MDLARKWGWSRARLHRLVAKKAIPHLRIGERNDVFFQESVVEAWLREREVPVASMAPRRESSEEASRLELCRELGIEPEHQFT
jgi:predicted DNA-binding transcriptional regulator AlpA